MADVGALVLPFFGLILIGVIAARLVRLPESALGWMNVFVLYVALPTLFFELLSHTPVDQLAEWTYIVGAVLATYIVFAIMFSGYWFTSRGNIPESTISALAACYGNIGYMGPAIALLALGAEAAVPVALIVCFENIAHFTILPILMAIAGRTEDPPLRAAGTIVLKVITHPLILASMLGIGVATLGITPPLAISRMLEALAPAAAPCALFAMGVTLALRPLRRAPVSLVPITLLKLCVHPMICLIVLSLIGDFDPLWVYAAVLLAGLPTGANVYVVAQQYGVWIERASASVLITTAVSVVSVTVLVYLITSGSLPPDLFPG